MAHIRIAESREINAPAAAAYDIIADYKAGHPRILPPQYFGALTVESGGKGTGTRIAFEMKAFGKVTVAKANITEPHPGRELRETLDAGIVTTFRVDPVEARKCRVTIETTYQSPGLRGWIESILAPRFLRKVYVAELGLLAREAEASTNG